MFQSWQPEIAVLVPMHIIFERRPSDFYEPGEDALPATPLLRPEKQFMSVETRLREQRKSDIYESGGESALLGSPFFLREASPVSTEPLLANGVAGHEEKRGAVEPERETAPLTPVQVKFRQALIEVDNPEIFWDGVVGGQVAAIEEQQPLRGALVFALFEDAVGDLEFSETWLVGYLLGLSDALLRRRKIYPRAYTSLLKPLK